MIHTIRTVAVGDQESKIDSPIILYRGDREVEVEFTINGSKFTFTNGGNVIKSTNATHGQLVINTPTGENMFSEVTECHDGKVVFVITKEMIDELIEVGFYSFQIRLFDESQVSRVTIPPVLKGIDIRNPIAAEDETNVVDVGLVDYAVVIKDEFEDLSTFLPDGNYNKTEWESKDVISGAKLNKIEDALYNINSNMEATDLALLNRVENIDKTIHGEIDKLGNELESEVEEFERDLNNNVERFKIDTNVAMNTHKNEVSDIIDEINSEVAQIRSDIVVITSDLSISEINDRLSSGGTFVFKSGNYYLNSTSERISPVSNSHLIFEPGAWLIYNNNTSTNYYMIEVYNCENVVIEGPHIRGCRDTHEGTEGEWGHGIQVVSSRNVKIIRPYIEKTWGDGIYIGYRWSAADALYRTSNILIEGAHIYKCSRNGISVCSGDTIIINDCYIEGVDRTAPKAGIDIEPENNDPSVPHLSNLHIYNLTTIKCDVGIGVCPTVGYEGSTVIIDNHINQYSCGFAWWGSDETKWYVYVNNSKYYDSFTYAVVLDEKKAASTLVFNNLSVIGRARTNDGDVHYNSAIYILGSDSDVEYGNVIINGLTVTTYDKHFEYPVSVIKSLGSTAESVSFKNITVYNLKTQGTSGVCCFKDVDAATFRYDDTVPGKISSNYHTRLFNYNVFIKEIIYHKLNDYTYGRFDESSPDGYYKLTVLNHNGFTFTIDPGNLTVVPSNSQKWSVDSKIWNLYKSGTTLYFL